MISTNNAFKDRDTTTRRGRSLIPRMAAMKGQHRIDIASVRAELYKIINDRTQEIQNLHHITNTLQNDHMHQKRLFTQRHTILIEEHQTLSENFTALKNVKTTIEAREESLKMRVTGLEAEKLTMQNSMDKLVADSKQELEATKRESQDELRHLGEGRDRLQAKAVDAEVQQAARGACRGA